LKTRRACSNALTAASAPGLGGFFGGAGAGFITTVLDRESTRLIFDFFALRAVAALTFRLDALVIAAFLATFFADREVADFFGETGFFFEEDDALDAAAALRSLGFAVIFPGRRGFLVAAFFATAGFLALLARAF